MARILTLPVEVRLQIYQDLIIYDRPYKDHPWGGHLLASWAYRFHRGILGVNKQINQEAMGIFYGMNQLRFYINTRPSRKENAQASMSTLKAFQNSLCFQFVQRLSFDMHLSCKMNRTYFGRTGQVLENITKAQVMFDKLCLVLAKAPRLREIEIAWNDDIPYGHWELKRLLLRPLGRLPANCAIKVDVVIESGYLKSCSDRTFLDNLQESLVSSRHGQ